MVRDFSERTFRPPWSIRAEHKNGLLRVFLPKREENKPRKISVQVQG